MRRYLADCYKRDGSTLCDASDYPRGNPENPIDRSELEMKFDALVGARFGGDVSAKALAISSGLVSVSDVSEAFSALRT